MREAGSGRIRAIFKLDLDGAKIIIEGEQCVGEKNGDKPLEIDMILDVHF
jgi:hypothetical protein